MSVATIMVEDYKGKTAPIRVTGVTAIKNSKAIADWIKDHTDARVVSYGITLDYDGDSTSAGKYDRVLQRLNLLYEDQDGNSKRFSIPAPSDESVNDDQEPESDLAEDVKDLLVANVKDVKSLTYNGGGLRSRMPSKEARSKEMTGI